MSALLYLRERRCRPLSNPLRTTGICHRRPNLWHATRHRPIGQTSCRTPIGERHILTQYLRRQRPRNMPSGRTKTIAIDSGRVINWPYGFW